MKFKKVLAIALILATLCMTVTAISAINIETIDIGEITKGNVHVTNYNPTTYEEDFTVDVEVDISDLSSSEKEELEDVINKNDTAFILNFTSGTGTITIWDYQGADDAHISGDTLYITHNHSGKTYGTSVETYDLSAVSFNTTEGRLFTTG